MKIEEFFSKWKKHHGIETMVDTSTNVFYISNKDALDFAEAWGNLPVAIRKRQHVRRDSEAAMLFPLQQVIIDVVCNYYGKSLEELKAADRTRMNVEARGMIAYFLYRMIYGDSVAVGEILGKHSSTIREKISQLWEFPTDQEAMKLEAIKNLIKTERTRKGV